MDNFLSLYRDLNSSNLHLLTNIYSTDVEFIDPAHTINGIEDLTNYFSSLYQNIESINFTFHDVLQKKDSSYVQWAMTFRHKSLDRGKPITVNGATFLRFNDDSLVIYHRDYFDLGAMLYEHLPLLGRLLMLIKGRLGT